GGRDGALGFRGDSRRPAGAVPACPYLDSGVEYVGFTGNGAGSRARLRGRGYRPATWAARAGYPAGAEAAFLADLRAVAGPFGLVAAGHSPADGTWRDLDGLVAAARTAHGRRWLGGCLVRVYAPADYLARWRSWF